jgi:hypothetical protein
MQPKAYPYDTRKEEAKIMRALVVAGDAGLTRGQLWRIVPTGWKLARALRRLFMFNKAGYEPVKTKIGRYRNYRDADLILAKFRRERWFALVADDTIEHGLDPEWTIEVAGA